ncbi:MAG: hypothetical protein IJA39_05620 [Clostridia bacterium]|nr:hypothetical protein [Clostridia bacterium]
MKKKSRYSTERVFIPKETKNDDSLFVSVNGKRILVKKGEYVELPQCFAEVINSSRKAQAQAEKFISSVSGSMN